MESILEPIRENHKLPALAGAIVTSKGIAVIDVAGIRKNGSVFPVTVDDKWHLGSCTKAMTATLIGALVEKGSLTWETTIGETFPELVVNGNSDFFKINLLHLLSHHSGLPRDIRDIILQ